MKGKPFGYKFEPWLKTSKEDLFVVKLAAFELDLVKNSNNREIKSRLRKAKTPIEVLETLMELKTISEIPV